MRTRRAARLVGVALAACLVLLALAAVFLWFGLGGLGPDGGPSGEAGVRDAPAASVSPGPQAPTGPMPTSFPACGREGTLEGYACGPLGVRATWRVERDLPAMAQQVLQTYRGQEGLELHHADYLDLLGNVWACLVVSADSWAELSVVQDLGGEESYAGSHSQGGPCLVSVMRLGQGAAGAGFEQADGGDAG